MDEDAPRKVKVHEIGMPLDNLSAGELESRIVLLEQEIDRLRQAKDARQQSRSAAEQFFKTT